MLAIILLMLVAVFTFLSACKNLSAGKLELALAHGAICFVCVICSIIIFFHL